MFKSLALIFDWALINYSRKRILEKIETKWQWGKIYPFKYTFIIQNKQINRRTLLTWGYFGLNVKVFFGNLFCRISINIFQLISVNTTTMVHCKVTQSLRNLFTVTYCQVAQKLLCEFYYKGYFLPFSIEKYFSTKFYCKNTDLRGVNIFFLITK